MSDLREYTIIVEFSYDPKSEQFVVRFLDNNSYVLKVSDLPKKVQTRKPEWENAVLSDDKSALVVPAGGEDKVIPFNVIHARGTLL